MQTRSIIIRLGILLLATAVTACSPAVESGELLNYVRSAENGLHHNIQSEQVLLDVQYKPLPSMIALEVKQATVPSAEFDRITEELEGFTHFSINLNHPTGEPLISALTKGSDQVHAQLLQYLSFEMQRDFRLIADGDTLAPAIYHFEPHHGMVPYETINLAFPIANQQSEMTLHYNDKIFGIGTKQLIFTTEALKNIPELKQHAS